ncbi:hypothetical protein OG705_26355 [Streptomyces sp. NBC_00838]|uniref:hypothetical protein n=1 Tax=Streptomyces sp. NBC_00838 TaxID=2903680 RepID=UPI00386B0141|nr:hypothetical protein OG705_26355 [Streptomyces sp. NBC_00838]
MARRRILLPALALGGLWWWAVLRLALAPEHAGVVEGAVAAGGWGLSLLPVHAAARTTARPERRAVTAVDPDGDGSQGTGPSWQRGHQ